MKKILLLSTLALALLGASGNVFAQTVIVQEGTFYGTKFSTKKTITPGKMTEMMMDKDKLEDTEVKGYISKVCQREGCWMVIRSNEKSNDDIMVRMKDHAFVVPKDIAGKTAVVHGTVAKKMQSVAEQKHYLEDAGAPADEIAKITAPKAVYEMQVTGVYMD